MGKTLRYGEFKFDKGFGFNESAQPEGRKLVQFYAGGGKVKAVVPKPGKAPVGALAQAAPRGPKGGGKGMPNLMARAARPGGMAEGGAVSDREAGMMRGRLPGDGPMTDREAYEMTRARKPARGAQNQFDRPARPLSREEASKNMMDALESAARKPVDYRAKGGAIKAAVHKHERAMHPGKPMTKLARGGVPAYSSKPKIGGKDC